MSKEDPQCAEMQRYLSLVSDRRHLVEILEEQVVEEAFLRTQCQVTDEHVRVCEEREETLLQHIVDLRLHNSNDGTLFEVEDDILIEMYRKQTWTHLFETHCAVSMHANTRKARRCVAVQQRNRQMRELIQSMEEQMVPSAFKSHVSGHSPAVLSDLRGAPRRPRSWTCVSQSDNPFDVLPVLWESSEFLLDEDSSTEDTSLVLCVCDAEVGASFEGASLAVPQGCPEEDAHSNTEGEPLSALGDVFDAGYDSYDEMGSSSSASASLASTQESCENDVDCGAAAESPSALDDLFRSAAEFHDSGQMPLALHLDVCVGGRSASPADALSVSVEAPEDVDPSPRGVSPSLGESREAVDVPSSPLGSNESDSEVDVTFLGTEAFVDPVGCFCRSPCSSKEAVEVKVAPRTKQVVVAPPCGLPRILELNSSSTLLKPTPLSVYSAPLDSHEAVAMPATLPRSICPSSFGHITRVVREARGAITDANFVEIDLDEFCTEASPTPGTGLAEPQGAAPQRSGSGASGRVPGCCSEPHLFDEAHVDLIEVDLDGEFYFFDEV
uniref:Uncharacterized protein n=1 Tax=Noctiluca scintillans TaxID=2966 RepID=A0A7S1EYX7_NOCSC